MVPSSRFAHRLDAAYWRIGFVALGVVLMGHLAMRLTQLAAAPMILTGVEIATCAGLLWLSARRLTRPVLVLIGPILNLMILAAFLYWVLDGFRFHPAYPIDLLTRLGFLILGVGPGVVAQFVAVGFLKPRERPSR